MVLIIEVQIIKNTFIRPNPEGLRFFIQYCAKVMQTIIDEYCALFSPWIAER